MLGRKKFRMDEEIKEAVQRWLQGQSEGNQDISEAVVLNIRGLGGGGGNYVEKCSRVSSHICAFYSNKTFEVTF